MESFIAPLIGLAGTVFATLLGWIGWLIKKRLDDSQTARESQEEMKLLIEQFVNNQEITLDIMRNIVKGVQITLKSDDLQFQSAHESGLMNGESVEQRKIINAYLDDMTEVEKKLDKICVNRALGK